MQAEEPPPTGGPGRVFTPIFIRPGSQANQTDWDIFMSCPPCAAEFHNECYFPENFLCCCDDSPDQLITIRQGPVKEAENMKDPISTGRKRAAIAKPIPPEGMVCEWAGLLYAGGGVEPIIGCNGNMATNIHHGPDKDVLNNDVDTNLHRICANCHNRWHTINDPRYGVRPTPGTPFVPLVPYLCKPHDTDTKATIEQIFENEINWANKQTVKAKD